MSSCRRLRPLRRRPQVSDVPLSWTAMAYLIPAAIFGGVAYVGARYVPSRRWGIALALPAIFWGVFCLFALLGFTASGSLRTGLDYAIIIFIMTGAPALLPMILVWHWVQVLYRRMPRIAETPGATPDYAWTCSACDGANTPGARQCSNCGISIDATGAQVLAAREARGR